MVPVRSSVSKGNVVSIAASGWHNLAQRSVGTPGDAMIAAKPILNNVVAIAAGDWHDLALKTDGTVVAWGAGGPNTNTLLVEGQNVVPAGLTNVIQIAAGAVHSLALVGSGPPVLDAEFTSTSWTRNGFSASLPTRNGRVYGWEFKTSLVDTNWASLPLRAGSRSTIQLTDPTAPVPQRFYKRRW